ncbi:MAG: hypothetical protein RLZZ09_963 [Pseudomonadota bacterium]
MLELLTDPFLVFFKPTDRLYWLYWLTAYTAGIILVLVFRREANTLKGGFSSLFPAAIYLHRSAIHDYLIAYVNLIWTAGVFAAWVALISITLSSGMESWLSAHWPNLKSSGSGLKEYAFLWTLLIFVVSDFCLFVAHYLQHRVPILWEFHKVHHSAEVMMPITVYRFHPLENLFNIVASAIGVGLCVGAIRFFVGADYALLTVSGENLLMVMFYLLFFNLRHSHIWLDYGPVLDKFFMSPAQHQIHHSKAGRHIDKNLGFFFAFWDYFAGTLYLPATRETLVYGLAGRDADSYHSFWNLLFLPFARAFQRIADSLRLAPGHQRSVAAFLLAMALPLAVAYRPTGLTNGAQTVFLEEMTWPEVKAALDAGTRTVIIPTGGTEQNGPHLTLGKHNAIVHYTAGQVARAVGQTLVAPIIAYVPEGGIEPAEGHMRYSGTLSVRENVFAGVLEDAARSLKHHGFTTIAFLGDSGGNQAAQRAVAESLGKDWAAKGIRVLSLGAYYADNHQVEYLRGLGYGPDQIGTHAGLRDTSELMSVQPGAVRKDELKDFESTSEFIDGFNGAVSRASTKLGDEMLRLKIRAAIEQLQQRSPSR